MSSARSKTAPAAATPTPRRERVTLLSFTGQDATKRIAAAQSALEASYLRARKRKLPVDLFIGSHGPREKTVITLSAHYTPDQQEDVRYLQGAAEAVQKAA